MKVFGDIKVTLVTDDISDSSKILYRHCRSMICSPARKLPVRFRAKALLLSEEIEG